MICISKNILRFPGISAMHFPYMQHPRIIEKNKTGSVTSGGYFAITGYLCSKTIRCIMEIISLVTDLVIVKIIVSYDSDHLSEESVFRHSLVNFSNQYFFTPKF